MILFNDALIIDVRASSQKCHFTTKRSKIMDSSSLESTLKVIE